jgi:hypothetical protein
MAYRQQQRESDRADRVIAACEQVERVTQAYARGKATCDEVHKAERELGDARWELNHPGHPVCTGRER